uniref:Uncharacterized protein n=1 Tax=Tanacetum cinerariifolium TaxID=118510 RepID=A0A699J3U5_TANCI|nr:hypothetical protein [Tanacetum cinerariifolium]
MVVANLSSSSFKNVGYTGFLCTIKYILHDVTLLHFVVSKKFGKLHYHAADPPDFLNYQGYGFLLISSSDNIHEELGVDVHEDSFCSDLINTYGAETSTDTLLKAFGFEYYSCYVLTNAS